MVLGSVTGAINTLNQSGGSVTQSSNANFYVPDNLTDGSLITSGWAIIGVQSGQFSIDRKLDLNGGVMDQTDIVTLKTASSVFEVLSETSSQQSFIL